MNPNHIFCRTCGVEYGPDPDLPDFCPICADERQYLPADGSQQWSSLADLQAGVRFDFQELEPGLWQITSDPGAGIGQRSLLVQTPHGNLLWDVLGVINAEVFERVQALGGVRWIAASHPHMYGAQSLWSDAFENAPILISVRDEGWIQYRTNAMTMWDNQLTLSDGLTLHRLGGHFAGSAVAHWIGRDGRGALLASDTMQPVAAKGWVTFLRSYPNRIPLSPAVVDRMAGRMKPLRFRSLYGNFAGQDILDHADDAVQRSAERHIAWVRGDHDDLT